MAKKEDKRGLWLKTLTEQLSTGVDQKSLQYLHALQTKYLRDYLPFFQGISKNYQKGRIKEQADNAVDAVQRVLFLLSRIEETREVSEEDQKEIPELSETLSQYKEFFSSEQERNKRFQGILESIAREKGVALENLNVTPEMSSQALQETKKLTQKKTPFFEGRFTESPWHLGRGLQAAALGPYSSLFDFSKAALKGTGIGAGRLLKGLDRRRKKSESSDLLRTLVASGRPRPEEIQGAGQRMPGFDSVQSDERTHPLMDFFDKGAYKAKWTKELLELSRKSAEKEKSGSGLFGRSSLGVLGSSTAAVAGAASLGVLGLEKIVAGATRDLARRYDALGKKYDSLLALMEEERKRRQEFSKDMTETMKVVTPIMDDMKSREQGDLQIPASEINANAFGPSRPRVKPSDGGLQELDKQWEDVRAQLRAQTSSQPFEYNAPAVPAEVKAVVSREDIESIVRGAVEIMKLQNSQTIIQPPAPRLANIHDSGDVLTRELARGSLSLEE